jgi:predicted transcriptional regulator
VIDKMPRREREVFETLCGLGSASTGAVRAAMADPPSDSATRTLLRRLEAKGFIAHREVEQSYIYSPVETTEAIAQNALQRLVQTFFAGSAARATTALLKLGAKFDHEEIDMLQDAVDNARREAGQ